MNTLTKQKYQYYDRVSTAIDKVLRRIFGDEATSVIYKHLENQYSLKKDEIAEKIDVFTEGLEELLRSGAYVIEMKILEEIYLSHGSICRLEFERRRNEYDFVSQMKMLRMA